MAMQTVDYFEEKARGGDGAFAVAFAILQLVEAQKRSAAALDRLGMNHEKSEGPPGIGENIVHQLGHIAEALSSRD